VTGPRGLRLRCDQGHEQAIGLDPTYSRPAAELLAGILDGTSPAYLMPPRAMPGSMIGRCAWPDCGALFTATLFGFPPEEPAAA
jgi:hypothetical protein